MDFDINLVDIFQQLSKCIFWKDHDIIFRGGNQTFAQAAGLHSYTEIAGKTDYDFPWTPSQTALYNERDRLVLASGISFKGYEQQRQANGKNILVFVEKKPLFNGNNKIIGLLCEYQEITPVCNALSHQQTLCLKFTAQGMSTKEIAKEMKLSPRTIESYMANIKHKLKCKNIAALIAKSYEMGLLKA